jgi:hypothetical protein
MMPWLWANTMGVDQQCADDLHCRIVSSDFGGCHAFEVKRGEEVTVTLATHETFGKYIEVPHTLWSTLFLDIDRDGREEVVLAAGDTAATEPKGPDGLVDQETLVVYGWDEALGHYTDVSESMGLRFREEGSGDWAMAMAADLDQDGDLDLVATSMPRLSESIVEQDKAGEGMALDFLGKSANFNPTSPLTVLYHDARPGDGKAVHVRLRGPGHRIVGARIAVRCHDEAACEGLDGLLREVTLNGNFLGYGRDVAARELALGSYAGLVDVRVTARDGLTQKVVTGVPGGASIVLDAP